MRIIIHCGTHKTGSTTIQTALHENAKELSGYHYHCIVNSPRINARNANKFDKEWIIKTVRDAESSGVENFIFSAELFSTLTSDEWKKITDLLSEHEITFIVFFRHWVNFLPSKWAQYCLRCDTQSFPRFLAQLKRHKDQHLDARFALLIERLISVKPAEIKAVSYDNAISSDGLLTTCFSAFGMPENFVNRFSDSKMHLNVRKPRLDTEVIRLLNGIYADKYGIAQDGKFNQFLRNKPPGKFYMEKMLSSLRDTDVLSDLHSELIASEVTVTLSRNDLSFILWEESFLALVSDYSVNSISGEFFKDIDPIDFRCSQVEIEELRPSLKQKLVELIEI
ncbi:MAG: hypothetical protein GQ532_07195 [Methylomarinum sp.]|nr:hypothetical protein [Methylomarinum sp.]